MIAENSGVRELLRVVEDGDKFIAPNFINKSRDLIEGGLLTPYLEEMKNLPKRKRKRPFEIISLKDLYLEKLIFTDQMISELTSNEIYIISSFSEVRYVREVKRYYCNIEIYLEVKAKMSSGKHRTCYHSVFPIKLSTGKIDTEVENDRLFIINRVNTYTGFRDKISGGKEILSVDLFTQDELKGDNWLEYSFTTRPTDIFQAIELENNLVDKKKSGQFDKDLALLDVKQTYIENALKDTYPHIYRRLAKDIYFSIEYIGLNVLEYLRKNNLTDLIDNHFYEVIYIIDTIRRGGYYYRDNNPYLDAAEKYFQEFGVDINSRKFMKIGILDFDILFNIDRSQQFFYKLFTFIKEEEEKVRVERETEDRELEKVIDLTKSINEALEKIDKSIEASGIDYKNLKFQRYMRNRIMENAFEEKYDRAFELLYLILERKYLEDRWPKSFHKPKPRCIGVPCNLFHGEENGSC